MALVRYKIREEAKIGKASRPVRNPQPGEGSPHSVARTADRYRKRGQFDDAIRLCLQELKSRPGYLSARVVLGRAYLGRGDHAKAEEEFQWVVELSPDNVRARVHLGQICEAQGRELDAIKHYEAALELAPLDREILASLHRVRSSFSPSDSSLSRAETKDLPGLPAEVSALQPIIKTQGDLLATETLADLYASQGLADRAAAIYKQLLDKEPFREGIREKLTALGERPGGVSVEPMAASATLAPNPPEASQPQSLTGLVSLYEASGESAAVVAATPLRMSREQMLLEELQSWLQGIRRYRKMAAASE